MMVAKGAISVLVLLFLGAVMGVLARRFRDLPPTRLLVNLLFPFSHVCIVAFLLFYSFAYDLPDWMFATVAVVGVLCGPVDLILFKALREAEERDLARERVRLLEEQVRAQEEYLQRLSEDIEEARRIRAAIAAELEDVESSLDREQAGQASEGLLRVVDLMDSTHKSFCAHPVVDALISLKAGLCADEGIRMEVEVALADDAPVPSVELCAVFSNLLDNAIRACREVPEGERFLLLKAREDVGYLVVRMENSCVAYAGPTSRPRRKGSGLARHGWGLSILETLAERRDGKLETQEGDGVFATTVVLRMDAREA